jgi:hypothetical protein
MGTIRTLPAKRPEPTEVIVRRWQARALQVVAKRHGMTTEWRGHVIYGFDKAKQEWVPLWNSLI